MGQLSLTPKCHSDAQQEHVHQQIDMHLVFLSPLWKQIDMPLGCIVRYEIDLKLKVASHC